MIEEQRIPLVQESARILKRRRATARVTIKLQTTEEKRVVRSDVLRARVAVERIAVNREVQRRPPVRKEGRVLIIPVIEEQFVVRKRLLLKEEVHITLSSEAEQVEIPVVLRRNHAVVTREALKDGELSEPGASAMNRTVTAFYTSRQEAEQVRSQLSEIGVAERNIEIVSSEAHSQYKDEKGGFFGFLGRMFIPREDSFVYNEGLSRGHAMLTAHLEEDDADRAISVLEQSDAMDLDLHEAEWRTATSQRGVDEGYGYNGKSTEFEENLSAGHGGAAAVADSEAGDRSDVAVGRADLAEASGYPMAAEPGIIDQRVVDASEKGASEQVSDGSFSPTDAPIPSDTEQSIPVVRETLVVGKREVGRGGVRVRSYVVETPVEQQIALRSERVSVERRPVNETVTDSEALLRDGEITVIETEEVPVVAKEAKVAEEIIVRKESSERVETVQDTVRRTEVDVEDTRPAT